MCHALNKYKDSKDTDIQVKDRAMMRLRLLSRFAQQVLSDSGWLWHCTSLLWQLLWQAQNLNAVALLTEHLWNFLEIVFNHFQSSLFSRMNMIECDGQLSSFMPLQYQSSSNLACTPESPTPYKQLLRASAKAIEDLFPDFLVCLIRIQPETINWMQFLFSFTVLKAFHLPPPHTHTQTFYPGQACHEGVCTSSLLVSVDAPGCQPSAACSKKSRHGLKRKHYFMEKQKMYPPQIWEQPHLSIRSDALGSESQCNQSSFLPVPNCLQVSLDAGRC